MKSQGNRLENDIESIKKGIKRKESNTGRAGR